MTTVTGTLLHPISGDLAEGYVTFHLVNERGERVFNASFEGNTIVDGGDPVLLVAGAYSVTGLAPNSQIETEDGSATFWARVHERSRRALNVPTSGTWNETAINAEPIPLSPDPTATNLITSATITSQVTGLVVSAFQFASVAGTLVTVPDLAYGVKIEACAPIICPATANIVVGAFITNIGSGSGVGVDYLALTTANLPGTARPFAVLPPHSSANYQLLVYSFSSVTLTVDAQAQQPAGLWVYGI